MHLLIDGYCGDKRKMYDREALHSFLSEYPKSLGMTKIYGPAVLHYDAPNPEDSGVSGFVVIAESHISIHTFPERDYINIDIFSCKSFDSEKALQDIKDFFSLKRVKSWTVERGLEHYDPRLAVPDLEEQVTSAADD